MPEGEHVSRRKVSYNHNIENSFVEYTDVMLSNWIQTESRVLNPEGYTLVRYADSAEHYSQFYYCRDYLGNNVAVWNASTHEEEQYTMYYPSGLPMISSYGEDVQSRKYGDKEFVSAFRLDEYDSEARWYYPAIMRTTTMDPLCEKYYSTSPYAWCGNNPVNIVDPDGKIANKERTLKIPLFFTTFAPKTF